MRLSVDRQWMNPLSNYNYFGYESNIYYIQSGRLSKDVVAYQVSIVPMKISPTFSIFDYFKQHTVSDLTKIL